MENKNKSLSRFRLHEVKKLNYFHSEEKVIHLQKI